MKCLLEVYGESVLAIHDEKAERGSRIVFIQNVCSIVDYMSST